jgi:hypothetical protein
LFQIYFFKIDDDNAGSIEIILVRNKIDGENEVKELDKKVEELRKDKKNNEFEKEKKKLEEFNTYYLKNF